MKECTNLDFSRAINLLESSKVKCEGIFTPTAGECGNVAMQHSELTVLTWICCINFTDMRILDSLFC